MSVVPMRPSGPDAEAITRSLRGYTELHGFDLALDGKLNQYSLRLTLANGAGKTVVLACNDVQHLELNSNGDGFEQLPSLRVEDVRADGLDRIHFTVDELEAEAIFFHCASVELLPSA